ncbi:MAG: response regulator [Deltaproteobacteria bacterium]|nr:response regulator [Deltaproteobacteria bacterium]
MNRRIMVVDDDPGILLSTTFFLKQAGFEVSQAANGREALRKLLGAQRRRIPYDLLITDNQMPEMSGRELFQEIRLYTRSLPVFVVSGLWDAGFARELEADGRAAFFLKPVDLEEFVTGVKFHMEGSGRTWKDLSSRLVS